VSLLIDGRAQNRFNIQNSVVEYLKTLPDYEIWKDMFESSVGKTVIDLISGISELLMFKMDGRLKEQYLFTALNKTSIYLIADMLGYNVNRKAPAVGTIDLIFQSATIETILLSAGTVLEGSVSVTTLETVEIPVGTTTFSLSGNKIQVIEGHKEYLLLTSTPNNNYYYNGSQLATIGIEGIDFERIIIPSVSFNIASAITDGIKSSVLSLDNYLVDSNGNLLIVENNIPWVDKFLSLDEDSVVVRTYYNGGIYLLFGDATKGKKLSINDHILVQYLSTTGKDTFITRNTDLGKIVIPTISGKSVIANVKVIDSIYGGSDEDSIEKLRYMLAGWHSTQDRAVTLNDWKYILLSYPGAVDAIVRKVEENNIDSIFETLINKATDETLITANELITLQEAVDRSCCTVEICVLTQNMIDETREEWANPEEYWDANGDSLLSYVDNYKMITTRAIVFNPIYKHLEISFSLTVNRSHPSISNLHDIIYGLLNDYIYKLGKSFYLTEITKKIYDTISEVNRAEVPLMVLDGEEVDPYTPIVLGFGEYLRTIKEDLIVTINY